MLSLTQVKCPHCGAKGQVILPPLGTIIVGPCPECKDMVALFCGRVLALDTDVMVNHPPEEKRQHLLDVLMKYLENRVDAVFSEEVPQFSGEADEIEDGEPDEATAASVAPAARPKVKASSPGPISKEEVDEFRNVHLPLLDDNEYFRSVFGS